MAITRNNLQTQSSATSATSYTISSYTVNSGSNRVLIVFAHIRIGSTGDFTATATWDGNAMTEAVTNTNTGTSRRWRTYIWYYIAPTVKSADIVISTDGTTAVSWVAGAVTLQGAKQSSPVGITQTSTVATANMAFNGVTVGSIVLTAHTSDSAGPVDWAFTTSTELYDVNQGDTTAEIGGAAGYYDVPSSGNVTLTATKTGTGQGAVSAGAEFLPQLSGEASATLAAVTSSATGTVALKGTASVTLDAVTSSATGTVALKGTSSVTLDAVTSSATGARSAIERRNPQSQITATNGTVYTMSSYTVDSGLTASALVVKAHIQKNNLDPDFTASCTYGGVAMTEAVMVHGTLDSPNRRWRTYIWYLLRPTAGTADIVVTNTTSVAGAAIGAVTLVGVRQSTATGVTDTDSTNPANSLELTGVTANSMIIAAVTSDSGGPPSWTWTNATETYDLNNGDTNTEVAASAAWLTVWEAGNYTLTATRSATGQGQVGAAAEFMAGFGGTLSVTLAAVTSSTTGVLAIAGTSSVTLDAITSSVTGVVPIIGTASATLDDVTLVATGELAGGPGEGTASITLDAVTSTATGVVAIAGVAAVTLDAVTSAATGTIALTGTTAITLADLTSTATGALAIVGTSSVALDDVTLSATGHIELEGSGTLAVTLNDVTSVATGALAIAGTSAMTLADVTMTAAGAVGISAVADVTLDDTSLTATGVIALSGQSSVVLAGVTLAGTGALAITGQAATTLANVTLTASGALDLVLAYMVGSVRSPARSGRVGSPRPVGAVRSVGDLEIQDI